MATEPREHLVDWLRDAYAMEKQALEICERQAKRLDTYPELQQRIAQHAEETKDQIRQLDRCFEILGEESSMLKDAAGSLMGNVQALSGMFFSDEVVKGSMASYVFENMEIASYTILVAAADANNQPEIASICQGILKQEEDMAYWLRENIPSTVEKFLHLDMTDQRARA